MDSPEPDVPPVLIWDGASVPAAPVAACMRLSRCARRGPPARPGAGAAKMRSNGRGRPPASLVRSDRWQRGTAPGIAPRAWPRSARLHACSRRARARARGRRRAPRPHEATRPPSARSGNWCTLTVDLEKGSRGACPPPPRAMACRRAGCACEPRTLAAARTGAPARARRAALQARPGPHPPRPLGRRARPRAAPASPRARPAAPAPARGAPRGDRSHIDARTGPRRQEDGCYGCVVAGLPRTAALQGPSLAGGGPDAQGGRPRARGLALLVGAHIRQARQPGGAQVRARPGGRPGRGGGARAGACALPSTRAAASAAVSRTYQTTLPAAAGTTSLRTTKP